MSVNSLHGVACHTTDEARWPGTVDVGIDSTGAIALTCVRQEAVTLALSWTGGGGFDVYDLDPAPNGEAIRYGGCFGTNTSCQVSVPRGVTILIFASASSVDPVMRSWGGDCAGSAVQVRTGNCQLGPMDTGKTVSATFGS